MRLICLLLLALVATPSRAQSNNDATGIVTVFREHADSVWKNFSSEGGKWPGARLHVAMTLDEKPLLDMHAGTFASFRLPAGRHDVGFKQGGGSVSFELHPGERVFVHPGFTTPVGTFEGSKPFATVLSCEIAVQRAGAIGPLADKFVRAGNRLPESLFPKTCGVH